ncbi:hypothetical protein J4401_00010 [Candidatus Woesearchaeota archaeon]|nr:hypothetical protein [Candidatus Woesearchaeota archaeon]
MIVLCHKAVSGRGSLFEHSFLMNFLITNNKKAVVANEVWDAFRFRVNKMASGNKEYAEKYIVHFRGKIEPEVCRLNNDYQENEPQDYSDEILVEKTKDLVDRKWADIEDFITQEPDKYTGLRKTPKTLKRFYLDCLNSSNQEMRSSVQRYNESEAIDKLG